MPDHSQLSIRSSSFPALCISCQETWKGAETHGGHKVSSRTMKVIQVLAENQHFVLCVARSGLLKVFDSCHSGLSFHLPLASRTLRCWTQRHMLVDHMCCAPRPGTGVCWVLWARNPERVRKESKRVSCGRRRRRVQKECPPSQKVRPSQRFKGCKAIKNYKSCSQKMCFWSKILSKNTCVESSRTPPSTEKSPQG